MGKERDELEKTIEQLRLQLYAEIGGKRGNINKKKALEISATLDRLIVQWAKNYPGGVKEKNPAEK